MKLNGKLWINSIELKKNILPPSTEVGNHGTFFRKIERHLRTLEKRGEQIEAEEQQQQKTKHKIKAGVITERRRCCSCPRSLLLLGYKPFQGR